MRNFIKPASLACFRRLFFNVFREADKDLSIFTNHYILSY
jgi:hypothetical protein